MRGIAGLDSISLAREKEILFPSKSRVYWFLLSTVKLDSSWYKASLEKISHFLVSVDNIFDIYSSEAFFGHCGFPESCVMGHHVYCFKVKRVVRTVEGKSPPLANASLF